MAGLVFTISSLEDCGDIVQYPAGRVQRNVPEVAQHDADLGHVRHPPRELLQEPGAHGREGLPRRHDRRQLECHASEARLVHGIDEASKRLAQGGLRADAGFHHVVDQQFALVRGDVAHFEERIRTPFNDLIRDLRGELANFFQELRHLTLEATPGCRFPVLLLLCLPDPGGTAKELALYRVGNAQQRLHHGIRRNGRVLCWAETEVPHRVVVSLSLSSWMSTMLRCLALPLHGGHGPFTEHVQHQVAGRDAAVRVPRSRRGFLLLVRGALQPLHGRLAEHVHQRIACFQVTRLPSVR
mmetsp:Transcript_45177/g.101658  ORF Transcript_45177/g.101658 Transcript_45177/m.101658 type:complete len:298 (+) Transcript_45177:388-1281(+)